MRQAEQILDVATTGTGCTQDVVILIDRQGGMRMLDPAGWSVSGLAAEFGADAVYKVERRGAAVQVQGWTGSERCMVQRNVAASRIWDLPGLPALNHPMMLQVSALPPG